jgi:hypothetical protein
MSTDTLSYQGDGWIESTHVSATEIYKNGKIEALHRNITFYLQQHTLLNEFHWFEDQFL